MESDLVADGGVQRQPQPVERIGQPPVELGLVHASSSPPALDVGAAPQDHRQHHRLEPGGVHGIERGLVGRALGQELTCHDVAKRYVV
jgi:hypothetical protein